jgi:hypothetical protein
MSVAKTDIDICKVGSPEKINQPLGKMVWFEPNTA